MIGTQTVIDPADGMPQMAWLPKPYCQTSTITP
jgi:hypothetical protein